MELPKPEHIFVLHESIFEAAGNAIAKAIHPKKAFDSDAVKLLFRASIFNAINKRTLNYQITYTSQQTFDAVKRSDYISQIMGFITFGKDMCFPLPDHNNCTNNQCLIKCANDINAELPNSIQTVIVVANVEIKRNLEKIVSELGFSKLTVILIEDASAMIAKLIPSDN